MCRLLNKKAAKLSSRKSAVVAIVGRYSWLVNTNASISGNPSNCANTRVLQIMYNEITHKILDKDGLSLTSLWTEFHSSSIAPEKAMPCKSNLSILVSWSPESTQAKQKPRESAEDSFKAML